VVELLSTNITDVRAHLVASKAVDDITIQVNAQGLLEVKSGGWPGFGPRSFKDSLGNMFVNNGVYRAPVDGFVCAYENAGNIYLLSDAANPPTVRIDQDADNDNTWGSVFGSIRANDYFKVYANVGTSGYSWVPVGTGVPVRIS